MANVVTERLTDLRFLGGVYQDIENKFRAADYSEPLKGFLDVLQEAHRWFFLGEQSPGGEPWAPLASSTVRRKGHDIILFDTGKLQRSLISGGRTGAGRIREVTHRGLIFGTSVPYAIFHQLGGSHLPQREHVGMNELLVQKLADVVADHTVESLKRTTRR